MYRPVAHGRWTLQPFRWDITRSRLRYPISRSSAQLVSLLIISTLACLHLARFANIAAPGWSS
jgi:hypothetical protein